MKQLFSAKGGHSNEVSIYQDDGKCFECKTVKKCLYFDSSEGEYTEMIFCIECLTRFSQGHVSASDYSHCVRNY